MKAKQNLKKRNEKSSISLGKWNECEGSQEALNENYRNSRCILFNEPNPAITLHERRSVNRIDFQIGSARKRISE